MSKTLELDLTLTVKGNNKILGKIKETYKLKEIEPNDIGMLGWAILHLAAKIGQDAISTFNADEF